MLQLRADYRLGGIPRYYVSDKDEGSMLVPEDVKHCVVFVAHRVKDGYSFSGTAFFVEVKLDDGETSIPYLVTARHVIADARQKGNDGIVYLRVNLREGGATYIPTDAFDWRYHHEDSSVDVAVLEWMPHADMATFVTIPLHMFVTDEIIEEEPIGSGDEVFLTGLFVKYFGNQRNLPIVRTGNIALMPEEKILTKKFGLIDAALVEVRSIGGLSGSPVFVHVSRIIPRKDGGSVSAQNVMFLLGLVHGHWDLSEEDIPPGSDAAMLDSLKDEVINMGIAIVVPAQKIKEVIRQPNFIATEVDYMTKKKMKNLPTEDSATEQTPKNGEPFTRDDFLNALKKASKPVKKDDKKNK